MRTVCRLAVCLALSASFAACPRAVEAPTKEKPKVETPPKKRPLRAKARALGKGKDKVRLMFAGDTSLARGMTRVSDNEGNKNPAHMFQKMQHLVADADLFFANVEMVLSDTREGEAQQKKWRIRAEERFAQGLAASGLDVVSVSNNHMHDFGPVGIKNTLHALAEQGIRASGVEFKARRGQEPVVVRVGKLKVGFLSYNAHGDEYKHPAWFPRIVPLNRRVMLREVESLAKKVDVMVVSFHWGGELDANPYPRMESDAKDLVAAGADLIIGSGPHVAIPTVELPKPDGGKAIVAYCLGDFVFDKSTPWIRHRTDPRFLLSVEYDKKALSSWQLIPMRMDQSWRPYPADDLDPADWIGWPHRDQTFSSRLEDANVTRVTGDKSVACDEWTSERLRFKGHYLRWLRPRWACDVEPAGHHSIASTVETSGWVPRRGVFAHPHPSGRTEISVADFPLKDELKGFAGIIDWPLAAQKNAAPISLTVVVESAPQPFAVEVPHAAGWREFAIDTRALAGSSSDIKVQIAGGVDRKVPGFLFDLYTE